jgi:hypothetical protein
MTPDERQLITGLFDRMRSYGAPQKDREAEKVIAENVKGTPDAAYMLVQSVLVQEHALQEASRRIEDLEAQVQDLRDAGHARTAGSGSFLGGLFGGGCPASQPAGTSVPPIGSRATPAALDRDQPQPGWQASPPPPQQPAAGGFMRSAMATAAGVAGGMLAAGAIRDLLGGSANAGTSANSNAGTSADTGSAGSTEAASTGKAGQEQTSNDGYQDASHDSSWDDDDSWNDGGDLEI